MSSSPPEVFISYRREDGSDFARLLKERLETDGFLAFLDVDDVGSERYEERLLQAVGDAGAVVVVLSASSLTRSATDDDLFLAEVQTALDTGRHVVTVALPDFSRPDDDAALPETLRDLLRINYIEYSRTYWTESLDAIVRALDGRPKDGNASLSLLHDVADPLVRFDGLLGRAESAILFVAWPLATLAIAAAAVAAAAASGNLWPAEDDARGADVSQVIPLAEDSAWWAALAAKLLFIGFIFLARVRVPMLTGRLYELDSADGRQERWLNLAQYNNHLAAMLHRRPVKVAVLCGMSLVLLAQFVSAGLPEVGRAYWSSHSVDPTASSLRYVGLAVAAFGEIAGALVFAVILLVVLTVMSALRPLFVPISGLRGNGQGVISELLLLLTPVYVAVLLLNGLGPWFVDRAPSVGTLVGCALGSLGYYTVLLGAVVPIARSNLRARLGGLRRWSERRQRLTLSYEQQLDADRALLRGGESLVSTLALVEDAERRCVEWERASVLPFTRAQLALHLMLGALPATAMLIVY